jgi:hypothetical protein
MFRRIAVAAGLWALLSAAAAPPIGPEPAGARAFVEKLYAAYRGKGPDYLGRQAPRVFAPGLLALIRRDAAQAKGEVGFLDGDPICDCQDFGISRLHVNVRGAHDRATADVRFHNLDADETIRLDLVGVGGQWRIADIHTKDTPSLVQYLTQSLARPRPKE